eukprot:TRINITY_DN2142_c0_g1_i4.p1 TRINITY_DN2142_c0_g1~~TRINITY_DN2142_c0_g1_i4.p1  ORF type:complete len:273 (+),score=82.54 TRINITY_DN2142_c0_g1_i4:97-819(+)
MVGWRTSSIRRQSELPQLQKQRWHQTKYRHIMAIHDVPASTVISSPPSATPPEVPSASLSSRQAVMRSSSSPTLQDTAHTQQLQLIKGIKLGEEEVEDWRGSTSRDRFEDEAQQQQQQQQGQQETFELLEERMIRGLQQVSWRKVDVNFQNGMLPYLAHNNIHVKLRWLHFEGAGVISHLADSLQQELREAAMDDDGVGGSGADPNGSSSSSSRSSSRAPIKHTDSGDVPQQLLSIHSML